jgi:hypothetical protein
VIAYLEQLEQDLVEAIDRREVLGQREAGRLARAARAATRLLYPRPAWLVVAALAVVIVAGAALLQMGSREEPAVRPPTPAPNPVDELPAPIKNVTSKLRIAGTLTRLVGNTWAGRARGPGGTGTLTLTGAPEIPAVPNGDPPPVFNRLLFRWDAPNGTLLGCVDASIIRRPYGRWVWDGPGTITTATGTLKKYLGGEASLGGRTMVSTPEKAYIGLGCSADRRGGEHLSRGRQPASAPRQLSSSATWAAVSPTAGSVATRRVGPSR